MHHNNGETTMTKTDKLMAALYDCIINAEGEDQVALRDAFNEYCCANRNQRPFPLRTKLIEMITEALDECPSVP
jgi:hypothetical protein